MLLPDDGVVGEPRSPPWQSAARNSAAVPLEPVLGGRCGRQGEDRRRCLAYFTVSDSLLLAGGAQARCGVVLEELLVDPTRSGSSNCSAASPPQARRCVDLLY